MNTMQPIRSLEDVQRFKAYYLEKEEYRNYLLVTLCLNTALRIRDILGLKWEDIADVKTKKAKEHLCIREMKTGKIAYIYLNSSVAEAVKIYSEHLETAPGYIFKNRKNKPISRVAAYNIITAGGKAIGLEQNISCHSLRKTFGYFAWQNDVPPALLMSLYNHSSFKVTKRYLGIEQADKDSVFSTVVL